MGVKARMGRKALTGGKALISGKSSAGGKGQRRVLPEPPVGPRTTPERSGSPAGGIAGRAVAGVLGAALVTGLATQAPSIARYLKAKSM